MIVVVGGGITGLALGWELTRRGADVVVLEAEAEVGGVIRSGMADGRVIDCGPQRTRRTRAVDRVIEALDLDDRVLEAPPDLPLYVVRDGRLRRVPFSVPDLVRSDVVSGGAKARLLLEPLTRGADPEERVADLFTRKLGREVYEVLVAPLYGGLYASDPADMEVGLSLIHLLREVGVGRSLLWSLLRRGGRVSPPPACSFRTGMQELPRALGHALGERVRIESPVRAMRATATGWRVECENETIDAAAVAVCTSAPAASRIIGDAAPSIADSLGRLRYNPLGVVHLDAATELRGLGFQVSFTDRHRLLRGVTFNDSLFARRDLYTAYVGGALHPEAAEMDDDRLARAAVRDFAECTRYDAAPLAVSRAWMPAWDASWAALRGLRPPAGLHLAGSWRARPGLAGRLAEAEALARTMTTASTGAAGSSPTGALP